MKTISLTNSTEVVLVDDDDYPLLSRFNWQLSTKGYAHTQISASLIRMHRLVMGVPPFRSAEVDHSNLSQLDNRKSNLRWTNRRHNGANNPGWALEKRITPAIYKGVTLNRRVKGPKCWMASCAGKYLGYFATQEDAAKAYDRAAIARWGEFARTNFSEEAHAQKQGA